MPNPGATVTDDKDAACDCCERAVPVFIYDDGTALCDECIVALTGGVSA